jgi:MFS family permease
MQLAAAAALFGSGLFLTYGDVDIRHGFAALCGLASVLGIIDICLFHKVEEPRVTQLPAAKLRDVIRGPFQHPGFRSFIGFTCFWHFAAMTGAPFISLYLLQYVGMSLFQVLTLWTFSWLGGAISSRWLGYAADHYGNRPVLTLCIALKSCLMFSLLLVPRDPSLALWLLAPVFMVDMALNTGIAIANNGFLMKHSPAANRTMFIAAGTAVAGLVGGITSILCGGWLTYMGDWSMPFVGRPINGFHVLFAVSIMLRFVAMALVTRIQEPHVKPTMHVVTTLIGVTPMRVLRYPVGLYRRYVTPEELPAPATETVPIPDPPPPRRQMAKSA